MTFVVAVIRSCVCSMDRRTNRGEVDISPRWDEQDFLLHRDESVQNGDFEMSNRKPFNDRAGYVASRKNPLTNIHNVMYLPLSRALTLTASTSRCVRHMDRW